MKKIKINDKEIDWDHLSDDTKSILTALQTIEAEIKSKRSLVSALITSADVASRQLQESVIKSKAGWV